ncbi:hypothetical protein [Haloarchaeobius sp. TZWWS8]|uniref:hypothetical protein n=1 Tax=Haloarchaeobius sp. TZWWS8 TaxID=3446121 RepID=UPI003EC135A8
MLTATLLYVGGLAQYSLASLGGVRELVAALTAAGADPDALFAAVSGSRYGIPQPVDFVLGSAALVSEPPLPTRQWYGALAAVVLLPILGFAVNRGWRATRPYKWVSINELVGISLTMGLAAAAVGGAFLAGVLVMPFVFLVIIKHTHKSQQFRPSYLYIVGVSTPLVGLALDYAGVAPMLYVDLAALVLPVLTVVVLLLSAFVRPRIASLFD